MNPNPELDPQLDALLQALHRSPPRDPQLASRARDSFLAEAAQIAPCVSISTQSRLDKWKESLKPFWFSTQKEQKPMFNLFMTVLIVLGAVFGGGATTVAAAQAAQPDETLYPVKIWSEDIRLDWENDPQAKLDLALQFANRRTEEIQTLFVADSAIPEPVMTRFENQQQQALNLAAGMPDGLTLPALERIRNQARQQEQIIAQLQVAEPAAQQTRARIQTMLQTQEQMAVQGIQNPDWLRQQLRLREHDRIWFFTPTAQITENAGTPLSGSNPWTTGTPTPGSSYGPGESHNPWMDGTPTPGSGYGPGPGTGNCTTCTPKPRNGSPAEQPGTGNGSGDGGNGNGNNGEGGQSTPGGNGNGNKP